MGAMRVLGKRVAQDALALLRDEEDGATLVEYGLLAGLVAIAAIGAVSVLGDEMRSVFQRNSDELTVVQQKIKRAGKCNKAVFKGKQGKINRFC